MLILLREKVNQQPLPLINERIRAPRVQVIGHDGANIGVIPREKALQLAREVSLDLVLIVEQGSEGVPVVKIMDFGKAQYSKKKKQTEAKKHQKVIQVKEVKLSPKIGEHDFQTKLNQAIDFLNSGKRVKITLFFRGREMGMKDEQGGQLFKKIDAYFEQNGSLKNLVVEQEPRMPAGSTPGPRMLLWSRVYYLKK